MSRRNKTENSPTPLDRADDLLAEIGGLTHRLTALEDALAAELAAARARSRDLVDVRYLLEDRDRELKDLLRLRRREIFLGRDKVSLPHGVLLCGFEDRLHLPRAALERLKSLGWTEAVRSSESVNRAVISSWPEAKLAAIGATLGRALKFAYEPFTPKTVA